MKKLIIFHILLHNYYAGLVWTVPLPRFLLDTENCPLNACEVLKIWSQHFISNKLLHNDPGKG